MGILTRSEKENIRAELESAGVKLIQASAMEVGSDEYLVLLRKVCRIMADLQEITEEAANRK